MSKNRIRWMSYLVAAFAVAIGFGVQGHQQARSYQRVISSGYHRAFTELTTAAGALDTALQKSLYTTTADLQHALYAQIYAKSVAAQLALGELPYVGAELDDAAAFFAKTGDYAVTLAGRGGTCTEEEREGLRGISATAEGISQALYSLQSDLSVGDGSWADVSAAQTELARRTNTGDPLAGGTAFEDTAAEFPALPSLVYDGPFSQHLSTKIPLALEGLHLVTRDEARAAAAAFLGLKPELFTPLSAGEGALPTYGFSAALDGGEAYVAVTVQGGIVLEFFSSRAVGAPELTAEDAVSLAQTHLKNWGYPSMSPSYHIIQGNILTVQLAPIVDGAFCYPDLVKVSIALDNGRLMGLEAHSYLMHHTERTLSTDVITPEAARRVVSPLLTILAEQMALIPSAGEHEVLCYEFKCRTETGEHVIVYVNAQTGAEQKILLLLEDASGTLAL